MDKKNNLLGAHVSIADGFYNEIKQGEQIDATCIQIFTKSNRQWASKKITQSDKDFFIKTQENSNISVVVAHASYLINLGSKTDETVEKSILALVDELQRCDELLVPYLVLHPGTQRSSNEEESLIFTAAQINKVLEMAKTQTVTLLLETMAGQGSTIGSTFEQLATIINYIKNKKEIGICFDTCHAFASGYRFDTPDLYRNMWKNFDETIGIKNIKAFHINDSKKALGSKVDRHEDIGKGMIGKNAFRMIMQDPRFIKIPKIVETPVKIGLEDHKRNIEILKSYSDE
jgi:deoxyribonuclease-4